MTVTENGELPCGLAAGLRIGGQVVEGHAAPIDVTTRQPARFSPRSAGAGEQDIDGPSAVAHETFQSGVWRQDIPIHDRARLINRFADGIEARMADLYRLETTNNGRPITETKAQITRLAEWYRYNAALLARRRDAVVPLRGTTTRTPAAFPLGVVGDPVLLQPSDDDPSKSLAPALATGNTVVLKPSEQTPLTALLLGEIAR